MRAIACDRFDGPIAVRELPDPARGRRRGRARARGGAVLLDSRDGDVAARIAEATSGGAQLSIDALGSAAGAARALAREGRRFAL